MPEEGEIQEVVADKGYHSTSTMKDFKALDIRAMFASRIEEAGSGKAISKAVMRFTRIVAELVGSADADYCA